MISEESRFTEDWSNDAEKSGLSSQEYLNNNLKLVNAFTNMR